ncbi:MAG: hypothetical protein WD359_09745 [Dehalococcoidia bacterium]
MALQKKDIQLRKAERPNFEKADEALKQILRENAEWLKEMAKR